MDFNEGHITEGCDRIFIIMSMIDDYLLEHPAVEMAGVKDDISIAINVLNDAHQKIGALDIDKGK